MAVREIFFAWDIAESLKSPAERERGQPRVPRIVVAEDEFEMRRFLSSRLRRDGYEVVEAADGGQLLTQLGPALMHGDPLGFDLIISDIRMPGVSGLDVLKDLGPRVGSPPMILITAFGDALTHTEAERLGAAAVFDKPFDVDIVRTFVRGALRMNGGLPPAE